jgi:hypothetical protein
MKSDMSSDDKKLEARRLTSQYKGTDIKLTSQYIVEKVLIHSNLTISQNQRGIWYQVTSNEKYAIYGRDMVSTTQSNIELFSDVYSMRDFNLGRFID